MGIMSAKKFCCDLKFFSFVFDQNKNLGKNLFALNNTHYNDINR